MGILPPTSRALENDATRPYFLWWTDCTVGELRRHLEDPNLDLRAYWLSALLREANSRDVWLFTTPDEIRCMWARLVPHLGRALPMWAWLLDVKPAEWPPRDAHHA